ncbi:MarR family winged helix-turn-helix transcriptional regulator [Lutimaribacter marinistellae]|uniref:MarR family winged helix-turn-helix transcriptional regulator n=1 Tax=Lutimaribacter marinistellae TaxID=1820329 RepID=A0ABV7TG70_9RHOB
MTDPEPLPDDLFLVHPDKEDDGPAAATLSFSRSPTVLITFAGNRFTRAAARHYQEEFGIGAMDWRILVMLTREPGSSVSHAARIIGIDKAAVSRSLRRLETKGYVSSVAQPGDDRRKDWALTDLGRDLHGRILDSALRRQRDLLDGFTPQDVEAFTDYLRRFLGNIDRLSQAEN